MWRTVHPTFGRAGSVTRQVFSMKRVRPCYALADSAKRLSPHRAVPPMLSTMQFSTVPSSPPRMAFRLLFLHEHFLPWFPKFTDALVSTMHTARCPIHFRRRHWRYAAGESPPERTPYRKKVHIYPTRFRRMCLSHHCSQ